MTSKKKCQVINCEDRTCRRVRFPHPISDGHSRFFKWVEATNNPSLLGEDPMSVYNNKCICERHFSDKSFVPGTRRLKRNAIPEIYLGNDGPNSSESSAAAPFKIAKLVFTSAEEVNLSSMRTTSQNKPQFTPVLQHREDQISTLTGLNSLKMPARSIRCVVEGCPIEGTQKQITLFVFPSNKEQCSKWVEFCKNPKIQSTWETGKKMNRHSLRICGLHFKDEDFTNILHNRLLRGKIPSIFKPENVPIITSPNNDSVEIPCSVTSSRQEIPCVTTSSSNGVFRNTEPLQIVSPSFPVRVKCFEIATPSCSSDNNMSVTISSTSDLNLPTTVVRLPNSKEKVEETSCRLPSSAASAPSSLKHCSENLHNSVDLNSSKHGIPISDHFASELDNCFAADDSFQRLSSSSEDEGINLFNRNRKRELYHAHRKRLFKKKKDRMTRNLRKICKVLRQKLKGIFGIKYNDPSLFVLHSDAPQAAEVIKLIFECCKKKSVKKSCFSSLYNSISFSTGINSQFLSLVSHSVEPLKDSDRLCVLLFDEMPIKQYCQYDKSLDVIIGLEDHGHLGSVRRPATLALVFMVSALSGKWRQPIATYFTDKSTRPQHIAAIIKLVLMKCFESNLQVVATVCDIHFNKVRALKILGSTIEEPFFIFNEQKVVTLHDPTHILLSTRDFFMHHDVLVPVKTLGLEAEGRAKWQHIISAYGLDQDLDEFRILHRLKDNHFHPQKQERASVKLAAQVFSYSVASFLMNGVHLGYLPSEAVSTACFVKLVDNLFDSMNGSKNKRDDDKMLRRCVTAKSNHLAFWKEAVKEVESWKFFCRYKTFHKKAFLPRPPCQSAWLVNLRGMQILCANLMEGKKPLIDTLAPRCLHLHPLWNMFGSLRLYCGAKGGPTGVQFINAMKAHMLKRLLSKNTLPFSKYLSDSSWFLKNMQIIFKNDEDIEMNEKGTDVNFAGKRDISCGRQNMIIPCKVPLNSTATVCWFIAKNINFANNCSDCRRALCSTEADAELLTVIYSGDDLEDKSFPSSDLIETLTTGITMAEQAISCSLLQSGTHENIIGLLEKNLSFGWLEICCPVHFEAVSKKILSLLVSFCMLRWCNKINKILTLKRLYPHLLRSQEIFT